MKQAKSILIGLIVIFMTSCGGKNETADDGVYFQDFDNLHFWARDQWNLTNEKSQSGDFSAHTDSNTEYSQTFEMDYAYAKSKGYKALKVDAWVYVDNMSAKAGLVASCESSQGAVSYEAADLKLFITKPEQWQEVNVFMKLPEKAPDGSKIKIYLWSPNKSKIFMDNARVQLIK